MKYLVVGSGGREHTITWRLMHDGSAEEVFVMPGNGGIAPKYRVNIDPKDHQAVIDFCKDKNIDIVVVGPEAPLVDGLVDSLKESDIPAFGPDKYSAQLEGSKIFAKKIMEKCGVPTAGYHEFSSSKEIHSHLDTMKDFPVVIKLDGLAAGKGVGILFSSEEAKSFVDENYIEGRKIFVEDFLEGEEASILGLSDGENIFPLSSAQDHKRAFDNDEGPNTGGMGAYSPAPVVTDEMMEKIKKEVLEPVVKGMKADGHPFKGILYAGLMIKDGQIKVLEFNVRFGDPEAQVILPLLDCRIGDLFQASINGTLKEEMISFKKKHAITVVMASGGYPGAYEKGKVINGLDTVSKDSIVFHAGTDLNDDGEVVTSGGRVLALTSIGDNLADAKNQVYSEIKKVNFEKSFYRNDIAFRAFNR